jgi:hypothetical protein
MVESTFYLFLMKASIILVRKLKHLGSGNWTSMKETVLSMCNVASMLLPLKVCQIINNLLKHAQCNNGLFHELL